MAKRKVNWTKEATSDIFDIMGYYTSRNKSSVYSDKLLFEIKQKLKTLDFSVALPQKTTVENLFYFTHNHISVFFSIQNPALFVKFVIDDRRNPESVKKLLLKFH